MKVRWMLATTLLGLGLVACEGEKPVEKPAEPPKPAEPAPAAPAQLNLEDLKKQAEEIALVPSPAEMQRALDRAGIAAQLSEKVKDRKLKMDVPNKDQVAVRTGVILADMLLTVKSAPKERLIKNLADIKQGMTELGAGGDINATIDDISARVQNESVSRDDLLKELDELSGAIIPEISFEAGDRAVPLIKAGSWLEGANLVASTLIASGKYDTATDLLKQPSVVEYFLNYVKTEGADKAPGEVTAQLETTLKTLQEICTHEKLTEQDVKTIETQTAAVLDLL